MKKATDHGNGPILSFASFALLVAVVQCHRKGLGAHSWCGRATLCGYLQRCTSRRGSNQLSNGALVLQHWALRPGAVPQACEADMQQPCLHRGLGRAPGSVVRRPLSTRPLAPRRSRLSVSAAAQVRYQGPTRGPQPSRVQEGHMAVGLSSSVPPWHAALCMHGLCCRLLQRFLRPRPTPDAHPPVVPPPLLSPARSRPASVRCPARCATCAAAWRRATTSS